MLFQRLFHAIPRHRIKEALDIAFQDEGVAFFEVLGDEAAGGLHAPARAPGMAGVLQHPVHLGLEQAGEGLLDEAIDGLQLGDLAALISRFAGFRNAEGQGREGRIVASGDGAGQALERQLAVLEAAPEGIGVVGFLTGLVIGEAEVGRIGEEPVKESASGP